MKGKVKKTKRHL